MPLKDDLHKLAKLPRNKKNLEKIQAQLGETRELADNASETISALYSVRQALTELEGALDTDDNPLIPWAPDVREMTQKFLAEMPGEEADELDDLISEAEGNAECYEESLEEEDYTAEEREEIWGELLDSLENIAEALQ